MQGGSPSRASSKSTSWTSSLVLFVSLWRSHCSIFISSWPFNLPYTFSLAIAQHHYWLFSYYSTLCGAFSSLKFICCTTALKLLFWVNMFFIIFLVQRSMMIAFHGNCLYVTDVVEGWKTEVFHKFFFLFFFFDGSDGLLFFVLEAGRWNGSAV